MDPAADPLLAFIDQLSLDDKLYWRLARADALGEVEVAWERQAQPGPWRWRALGAPTAAWTCGNAPTLRAALPALGLEAEDLDRHIGASILTQATYADMVLTSARQLFGADVVARSIDDTRVFLDALSATARGLVERAAAPIAAGPDLRPQRGVEPRPRLQLVGGRPSAGRGGGPS